MSRKFIIINVHLTNIAFKDSYRHMLAVIDDNDNDEHTAGKFYVYSFSSNLSVLLLFLGSCRYVYFPGWQPRRQRRQRVLFFFLFILHCHLSII